MSGQIGHPAACMMESKSPLRAIVVRVDYGLVIAPFAPQFLWITLCKSVGDAARKPRQYSVLTL
jgi:hypothetical protein